MPIEHPNERALIKGLVASARLMERIAFTALGHENIVGEHETTLEITTESSLTSAGICIIGVCASMNLPSFGERIRKLAASPTTSITLRLSAGEYMDVVKGYGSPGLTYSNPVSMVIRKSTYECDRTLMVRADKSASELMRPMIQLLTSKEVRLDCEIEYSRK